MRNDFKFTKEQLKYAISDYIKSDNGVNELFSMVLNSLMYAEREECLDKSKDFGNKGNGYRKLLKPGIGSGLKLAVPRDRIGIFKPLILGILDEQESKIKDLCYCLYGEGLATRQINRVITDIYGVNYSKTSISRITVSMKKNIEAWLNRPLDSYYPCVFIDATYVKLRRDTVSCEAFYTVLALKSDGTREVLAIENIPTESASGWDDVLSRLKERGAKDIGILVSDDLKGLSESIAKNYSKSDQQKCTLHFQKSLSRNIRVSDRVAFCEQVKGVFNPDKVDYSIQEGVNNLKAVLQKWQDKYPKLKKVCQRDDLHLYFTYLSYDYRVRRMLYTTNWIERLNKSFKRTLKIRNALPSVDSVFTLMGYTAMTMEEQAYKYPIYNFRYEEKLKLNYAK